MTKSTILRAVLPGPDPVLVIGAHDGLGAKLAEEAGFGGVWASGLEISTSAGVPDANILTMTEFLDAAIEMNQATRLPIVCDCDTGFGNSNNVIHMVQRYEAAGIAAICIEDKLFPKVNSFISGRQELAPIAEFVGKIMAAKQTQETEDFVVIARVEALIAGWGEDEAIRRAEAYHRAGADAILIHSKQDTPDEIVRFLKRWDRRSPVVLVPTTYPQLTARQLYEYGASMIIYANHGLRAAIRAVSEVFHQINHTGSTATVEERLVPLRRVFELQGMIHMKEQEKKFLRAGARPVRAVIPAGGDLSLPEDLRQLVNADRPRALLDIYGKPLIQRQVETFAKLGIQDVTLVADIDSRKLLVDTLRVHGFNGSGLLDTVLSGLTAVGPYDGITVICYSDILFDERVVRTLVDFDGPIGILVDRSFKTDDRYRKKALDLVVTDPPPSNSTRRLRANQHYQVKTIGKNFDWREGHFEFIGMMGLNAEGYRVFMEKARCAEAQYRDQPFCEARRFQEASLTDFLQKLVDDGVPVTAIEQDKGWMEVHDFEDYRLATEQISRSGN